MQFTNITALFLFVAGIAQEKDVGPVGPNKKFRFDCVKGRLFPLLSHLQHR